MKLHSQDISVYLEPYYSQLILAWENNSTAQVATWQIDIAIGENNNGTMTYSPILQYFQQNKYLKLDPKYVNDSQYYYQITGLDGNGNVVVTPTGYSRSCDGCNVTIICKDKCNGPDYAYKINQYFNQSGTPGYHYLVMNNTYAKFDQQTQTAIPYYWFMTSFTYNNTAANTNYASPVYEIIHIKTSDFPNMVIKGPSGNVLTGNLVGIQKKISGTGPNTDFSEYDNLQWGNLISALTCEMSYFEQEINIQTNLTADPTLYTNLGCVADPNNDYIFEGEPVFNGGSGSGGTFGHIGPSGYAFLDLLGSSIVTTGGTGGSVGLPGFSVLNEAIENSSQVGASDRLLSSDIIQIEIVDLENNTSTIINPSEIMNSNGEMSLSSYSFTGGLYRAHILFSNNLQFFPFYFEGDNTQNTSNSLSNSLNVTIYPVPVINNAFSMNMIATTDLDYEYQLLNLNGEILIQENFTIGTGEEIIYHHTIDGGTYLPNNMLVNKFIFEDGSTLIIQVIVN